MTEALKPDGNLIFAGTGTGDLIVIKESEDFAAGEANNNRDKQAEATDFKLFMTVIAIC